MARRPSQQRLFRELAAKYGPEVAQAFMAAVKDLTREVEFQKLLLALERRDLDAAMEALHIDRAAFQPLEAKLVEAFTAGGQGAVASMPAAVSIGFRFDPGNQRAAEIIRSSAGRLITGLVENEINEARTFLADGMARGAGPRAVALDLVGRLNRATGQRTGGIIGLSNPQRAYVITARSELMSDNPALLRNYLTRGRRDRRYDRFVTAAIRDGKRVDPAVAREMTRAYSSRLLKLRGEIISRTESLPVIRAAKHEAYQQLVDEGQVSAADIRRTWHTSIDGRQRDTHHEMNAQVVEGLDGTYTSPSGAQFRYPGDASLGAPAAELIACRCDESISIAPRSDP